MQKDLELRVGPWLISFRRMQAPGNERRGKADGIQLSTALYTGRIGAVCGTVVSVMEPSAWSIGWKATGSE